MGTESLVKLNQKMALDNRSYEPFIDESCLAVPVRNRECDNLKKDSQSVFECQRSVSKVVKTGRFNKSSREQTDFCLSIFHNMEQGEYPKINHLVVELMRRSRIEKVPHVKEVIKSDLQKVKEFRDKQFERLAKKATPRKDSPESKKLAGLSEIAFGKGPRTVMFDSRKLNIYAYSGRMENLKKVIANLDYLSLDDLDMLRLIKTHFERNDYLDKKSGIQLEANRQRLINQLDTIIYNREYSHISHSLSEGQNNGNFIQLHFFNLLENNKRTKEIPVTDERETLLNILLEMVDKGKKRLSEFWTNVKPVKILFRKPACEIGLTFFNYSLKKMPSMGPSVVEKYRCIKSAISKAWSPIKVGLDDPQSVEIPYFNPNKKYCKAMTYSMVDKGIEFLGNPILFEKPDKYLQNLLNTLKWSQYALKLSDVDGRYADASVLEEIIEETAEMNTKCLMEIVFPAMGRYHKICKSVCLTGSPLNSVEENKELKYLAEKIPEVGNDLIEKLYAFTEDLFRDPDSKRDVIKPTTEKGESDRGSVS